MADSSRSKQTSGASCSKRTNSTTQETEPTLPQASNENNNNNNTFGFDLKHGSLNRNCDDIVGKRVLFIPRTFQVKAPSPTSVPSSHWSRAALAIKTDTKSSAIADNNRNCPLHSQHMATLAAAGDDQQRVDSAFLARQLRETRKLTKALLKGDNREESLTYSMMKTKHHQQQADKVTNSSSLSTRNNDCNLSCQSSSDTEALKQHLNSLPWKLGTIRAVSHRNLNERALSVMIEFDLLHWHTRDWYHIRDKSSDYGDDDDDDDDNDDDENEEDEDDKEQPRGEESCSAGDRSNSLSVSRIATGKKCRLSKDNEDSTGISSPKTKRQKLRGAKQVLKGSQMNAVAVDDEQLITKQEKSSASNIAQEKKEFKNSEVSSDGDTSEEIASSGDFSVLLIESSICCLNRYKSPIGQNKLWPALTFEPLVDEIGLFNKFSTVKAVEYIDPDAEHESLTKTTKQSACDMKAILSELESEYGSSSLDDTLTSANSGAYSSSIRNNITSTFRPTTDTSGNDRKEDINETRLEFTAASSHNSSDLNRTSSTANSCLCWSPKVEFVYAESICRPLKEEPCNSERKPPPFVVVDGVPVGEADNESARTSEIKLNNQVMSSSSSSSSSAARLTGNVQRRPFGQLESCSANNSGNNSGNTNSTSDISSFRRFLRFFHRTQLSKASRFNADAHIYSHSTSQPAPLKVEVAKSEHLEWFNYTDGNFSKSYNTYAGRNHLVEAIIQYPQMYHLLREWHLYQDAQSLLGNVFTAALLVGNRVRVYRCSGTTQWYTAVIISYDERSNLLTLIDDTVLEEHHEDPTLLEMHLIDDGLIQSIIEGDDATVGGATRRRNQRANQRQAAKTAQIAIMNSSATNQLAANTATGSTCNSNAANNSSNANVISKQPAAKSLASAASSTSAASLSLSPSTSATTSSCSSSAALLQGQQQLQVQSFEATNLPLAAAAAATAALIQHTRTNSNSTDSGKQHTSSNKINSISASNKDATTGKTGRGKRSTQHSTNASSFSVTNDDAEAFNQSWPDIWTTYRCEDELHTPQLQIKSSPEGERGQRSSSGSGRRQLIGIGADHFGATEVRGSSILESSSSSSSQSAACLLSRTSTNANLVKLGHSKGAAINRNFLSHRLRLEALEERSTSVDGTSLTDTASQLAGQSSEHSSQSSGAKLARNRDSAPLTLLSSSTATTSDSITQAQSLTTNEWNKVEASASLSSLSSPYALKEASLQTTLKVEQNDDDDDVEVAQVLSESSHALESTSGAGQVPKASKRQIGANNLAKLEEQQWQHKKEAEQSVSGKAGANLQAHNQRRRTTQQPLLLDSSTAVGEASGQRAAVASKGSKATATLEVEVEAKAEAVAAEAAAAAASLLLKQQQLKKQHRRAVSGIQVHVDGCFQDDDDADGDYYEHRSDDRESHEERKQQQQQQQQQQPRIDQSKRMVSNSRSSSSDSTSSVARSVKTLPFARTSTPTTKDRKALVDSLEDNNREKDELQRLPVKEAATNSGATKTKTKKRPEKQSNECELDREFDQQLSVSPIETSSDNTTTTRTTTKKQQQVKICKGAVAAADDTISSEQQSRSQQSQSQQQQQQQQQQSDSKTAPSTLVSPSSVVFTQSNALLWTCPSSQQSRQQQQQQLDNQQQSRPAASNISSSSKLWVCRAPSSMHSNFGPSSAAAAATVAMHSKAGDAKKADAPWASSRIEPPPSQQQQQAPQSPHVSTSSSSSSGQQQQQQQHSQSQQQPQSQQHAFQQQPVSAASQQQQQQQQQQSNSVASRVEQIARTALQDSSLMPPTTLNSNNINTTNITTTSNNNSNNNINLAASPMIFNSATIAPTTAQNFTAPTQQQQQQSSSSSSSSLEAGNVNAAVVAAAVAANNANAGAQFMSAPSPLLTSFYAASSQANTSTVDTATTAAAALQAVANSTAANNIMSAVRGGNSSANSSNSSSSSSSSSNSSSGGNGSGGNSNTNNNSNLASKTAAHSASHSALAAAATLQSLNQSHLNHHHHQQQQQQHQQQQQQQQHLHSHHLAQLHHYQQQQQQSNRPPSNPPASQSQGPSNMPKLGSITSTTSSDHQNHNHLALNASNINRLQDSNTAFSTEAAQLLLEESARIQQQQQQQQQQQHLQQLNKPNQTSIRPPPINWQDQAPPATSRWLYANPYATFPTPAHSFPVSSSSAGPTNSSISSSSSSSASTNNTTTTSSNLSTSAVNNLGNSNNMIGQEGDNSANNSTNAAVAAAAAAATLMRNINNSTAVNAAANMNNNNSNNSNNNNNNNNNNNINNCYDKSDRQMAFPNAANHYNTPPAHLEANKSSIPLIGNTIRSPFGFDNKNGPIIEASKVQQQLISEGFDKGLAERLGLLTYNLTSPTIPGTNKPKKFIYLDNIDGCRNNILKGEFYTKYEDVAVGILTNQLIVPEISLIDYLKRPDLNISELEKIDSIHKRCLGVSDYLCLLELTNRRTFQHISKFNDMKHQQSYLSQHHIPGSLNIATTGNFTTPTTTPQPPPSHNHQYDHHHHHLSQDQHLINNNPLLAALPAGKLTDSSLSALERNKQSSHSPSDSLARSQSISNNNNGNSSGIGSRMINAHSSSTHNPIYPPPMSASHLPPPILGHKTQPRLSPHHQPPPMNMAPNAFNSRPTSHNKSNPSMAHESPLGAPHSSIPPRQPPAAHQSSARPNIIGSGPPHIAHAHSSTPSTNLAGPPVTAHMSSKTPQTPKLHTQESQIKSSHIESHSPNRLSDSDRLGKMYSGVGISIPPNSAPSHFASQQPNSSFNAKTDLDPITGLPIQTLLSLKQQEIINREMALKRTGTPHFLNNSSNSNLMGAPHQVNITTRSPNNTTDLHLNSRSPMNPHFQSIYGSPAASMNTAPLPMFKSPSGQPNYLSIPSSNSSMPPPSSEYHKQLSLSDVNRLNESRSSMMSPNINNLSNEAQLKQYSALMNAYQQQQMNQQQQQQHLMMINKSVNPNNPLVIGLNPNGPYSNHHSPMRSPQASSEAMHLDIQGQHDSLMAQDGRQLLSQQPSPKQNQNQRSIITGSVSSAAAAPKQRNKKAAKQSPPSSATGDIKPSLNATLSGQNENLPAMNLISNSADNLSINNSQTLGIASQQQQQPPLLANQGGNVIDSTRGVADVSGVLASANASLITNQEADESVAIKSSKHSYTNNIASSKDLSNPQMGNVLEKVCHLSAHSSTPSIVTNSQQYNPTVNVPRGHVKDADINQNDGSEKVPLPRDKLSSTDASIQPSSTESQNAVSTSTGSVDTTFKPKFGNNSSENATSTTTTTSDTTPTQGDSNTQVASSQAPVVESSKYQKLYTKKAWLKNYGQEESKTGTDVSIQNSKTEMKSSFSTSSNLPVTTTKEVKPLSSATDNSNELKDSKSSTTKSADNKRKSKEVSSKKRPEASSRANKTQLAKQVVDNESELSNASTSDLDSDETESSKSTSDKKLRRMPRRKVKPSVEKDEQQNSNKNKSSKESASRKSVGKKEKIEKSEVSSSKRKTISSAAEANVRKSKKAKLSGKQSSSTASSKEDQKVSRRQVAVRVSSSKGDASDETEIKGSDSKRSTPRSAKAKDQVGESKSGESQSDNETLYSSADSEEGSLPSDETKSSTKKSKKGQQSAKKEPKSSVISPQSKMFLQTDPCYDIVPKSIRCLECRRVRQSSLKNDKVVSAKQSKTNWDDFCRFYEFRKLRYNKSSQIVVAGFSDLDDAKEGDKTLWLPQTSGVPTNFTYSIAKFILTNVGNEFCDLVVQERSAKDLYLSYQKSDSEEKITWKRAVNGLRELCDVCATTLFNCHYFCERCGFVVCLDCYQSRATIKQAAQSITMTFKKENDSGDDLSDAPLKIVSDTNENCLSETPENPVAPVTKKSKRDSCGWIFCAKNEEHSHEKLKLTQIIAGECLEELWSLLHETRERLNLGHCNCKRDLSHNTIKLERCDSASSKDTSTNPLFIHDEIESNSEGSHSTLKGLLLATHNGLSNSDERGGTLLESDMAIASSDVGSFKRDACSITNNYSSSPLNDEKMFNDSSNEDDLQEDTKLSEQVTAAIEGCISSLPNGSGEESPIRPMSPLSNLTNRSTTLPQTADSSSSNLSGHNSTSMEWRKWKKDDHELGYYWLCQGDLLVLAHETHAKNIKLFRQQWRSGKPVLIRGIDKLMKIDMWRPQFFGKEFGDYRSDLVDCRNGDIHRHSMKKYWEGFEPTMNGASAKKKFKDDSVPIQIPAANNEECSNGPSYYSGSALWRLKDWPPGQDFYEILPSHYEDFMNNLPLKDYTTRSGKLNLACRLPKEMLKPDLGPKMYSAYGTIKFPERGTTNLHLDISDAINVMVYVNGATSFKNGSDEVKESFEEMIEEVEVDPAMKAQVRSQKLVPGALWHVFRPEDSQCIRDFLNKVSDERNISPEKRNDPIHDQTWYLDQYLLDRLFSEFKVRSFPILQCMGDAIMIPAGAPHQVKNLQNCIKVANDFVSPENVRYCLKLTNEFRSLPETHMNQEDKLQIKNILYHSVKESLQYIKLYESGKLDLNDKSKIEDESVD